MQTTRLAWTGLVLSAAVAVATGCDPEAAPPVNMGPGTTTTQSSTDTSSANNGKGGSSNSDKDSTSSDTKDDSGNGGNTSKSSTSKSGTSKSTSSSTSKNDSGNGGNTGDDDTGNGGDTGNDDTTSSGDGGTTSSTSTTKTTTGNGGTTSASTTKTNAENGGTTSASSSSTSTTVGSDRGAGVLVKNEDAEVCKLLCKDSATTDDADGGEVDGWGFEGGQSCIIIDGEADTKNDCDSPVLATGPENPSPPGSGTLTMQDGKETCTLVCSDDSTDKNPDTDETDGWGWERGGSCVVSGTPADTAKPCELTLVSSTPGGTVKIGEECKPVCANESSDEDGDGWGWENDDNCIVSGKKADSGKPC